MSRWGGDAWALGILLDRLAAARPLGEEDREAVLALPVTRCACDLDQDLRSAGVRPTECTLLLDGYAYRYRPIGDGDRQIVSLCMRGDLIDTQAMLLTEQDHDVRALTRVEIARIERDALLNLALTRPAIGMAMWRETMVEGAIFREWIANIGRRSARGRIAHLLCEVALRSERAGLGVRQEFELPMTQEQLGDALGLTAVHVNRTLRSLQDDGFIQRSKRSVAVADWRALVAEAGFSPDYLHLPR